MLDQLRALRPAQPGERPNGRRRMSGEPSARLAALPQGTPALEA
jgi:hypothetical protein